MNTFYQLWKVKTPEAAQQKIKEQIKALKFTKATNLEEQALLMVGTDIYEKLIKHYTEKQWGTAAAQLPAFIIKRLPLRFTFDNNYFNDRYQGIPIGGYNQITNALLRNTEVRLNTDFFAERDYFESLAKKTVYTGKIDEYFNCCFGELAYRGLRFDHQTLSTANYQGNAVVNYTDAETPYTRIIEHKHFEFGTQDKTVITKEYSLRATMGQEPFYPINDDINTKLYTKYRERAKLETKGVIFGGRLAEYRYYDMHQVIASALHAVKTHLGD